MMAVQPWRGQRAVHDGKHCVGSGSALSCEEVGGVAFKELSGGVAVL